VNLRALLQFSNKMFTKYLSIFVKFDMVIARSSSFYFPST